MEAAQSEPAIWPGLTGRDEHGAFIAGGKCNQCGFFVLGPHDLCPRCWTRQAMTPVPVGRTGTLYSYSVIEQLPSGYQKPFAVGYIDIERGLRVFAHLRNEPATLRIGARVALEVAPLTQGSDQAWRYGPRYHAIAVGEAAA
jgi:uncharacterized OB-fold protein